MPSFEAIIIAVHVVAAVIFFVTMLGFDQWDRFLCFFLSILINFGLASAAIGGHRTFGIAFGMLALGLSLICFMHVLYCRRRA